MTKLEMAHDYVMLILGFGEKESLKSLVAESFSYADAMQAEADERENKRVDDVCSDELQAQRDAELYGTGFLKVTYDSDGIKYERLDPKGVFIYSQDIGLDSQVLKEWQPKVPNMANSPQLESMELEWQPDWSQAPDWANWWAMDGIGGGVANWYVDKPYLDDDTAINDEWNVVIGLRAESFALAPAFNYQGDWRDSLRKRPE